MALLVGFCSRRHAHAVHEDHGLLAPVQLHMPPCVALTVQLLKVWGNIVLESGTVLPAM